jgi:hypothetical protein
VLTGALERSVQAKFAATDLGMVEIGLIESTALALIDRARP